MSPDLLPDFPLVSGDSASTLFLERGIAMYRDAASWVWNLPYGRNTDRADPLLVFPEGRGTCSTKHALLALVAREHGQPVELVLGFYEMSEANTPGVGRVLKEHGISSILEAHCYLRYRGERVDLAAQTQPSISFLQSLISEERIVPEQIGEYKIAAHRRAIEEWLGRDERRSWWTVDALWKVREGCIAALGAGAEGTQQGG